MKLKPKPKPWPKIHGFMKPKPKLASAPCLPNVQLLLMPLTWAERAGVVDTPRLVWISVAPSAVWYRCWSISEDIGESLYSLRPALRVQLISPVLWGNCWWFWCSFHCSPYYFVFKVFWYLQVVLIQGRDGCGEENNPEATLLSTSVKGCFQSVLWEVEVPPHCCSHLSIHESKQSSHGAGECGRMCEAWQQDRAQGPQLLLGL